MYAADRLEWLKAYMDAGFTREEAVQLLCQPMVTINSSQAQYPPEMYEFWERQNAFATKALNEMDSE